MENFRCTMCGNIERECKCDVKDYCSLCQGAEDVRLCLDGVYYCMNCREICGFEAQYS